MMHVGITVEFLTCMKHIKLKVFSREIQICNLFGHTLFHWRVMALQSWTLQGILSKFLSTSKHWTRWYFFIFLQLIFVYKGLDSHYII